MPRCLTTTAFLVALTTAASAQQRTTVSLLVGPASYDFGVTGTSVAAAGYVTWFAVPALAVEPGITYLTYKASSDASSTLLFPELSVQAAVPGGPVRPYLGAGIGLTIPASGGFGTHRSVNAVAGVRIPVGPRGWLVRAEFRLRTPQGWWGMVTGD